MRISQVPAADFVKCLCHNLKIWQHPAHHNIDLKIKEKEKTFDSLEILPRKLFVKFIF